MAIFEISDGMAATCMLVDEKNNYSYFMGSNDIESSHIAWTAGSKRRRRAPMRGRKSSAVLHLDLDV